MPANTPNVGVRALFDPTDTASVMIANMSTIGGVFTPATDIDRTYFPIDTPVAFRTDSATALKAIGTSGTLAQAVNQIIEAGVTATIVAVVPDILVGDTAIQQMAKMVGIPSAWTGAWALTKAAQDTGIRPGILIAPGFASQRPFGVTGATISGASGTGAGATIAFSPAGATGAVALVDGNFVVTITNPGNYATGTNITATLTGCGTGATATVQAGAYANPVMAAFDAICDKLGITVAIGDAPSDNLADALQWAQDWSSSMNIIASAQGVALSVSGEPVVFNSAASIAALMVKTDQNYGAPYYNPGNHPLVGILGPSRSVEFNPGDPSCEANTLLQGGCNCIVQLNTNAISLAGSGPSGTTFWGFLNTYSDPNWRMINVIRTRKAIIDALPRALLKYIGQNLGPALATVIVQSIAAFLSELSSLPVPAVLPGSNVYYDPTLNDSAGLRVGGLVIDANWAETPALLDLQLYTASNPASFTILSNDIMAALTQAGVQGALPTS